MRISLNWLKEYVDIPVDAEELAHRLTMLGLEIEAIERPWSEISSVRVGKILEIAPHPDAEKLVVCKTDTGQGAPLQIVCGAKNMKVGDRVPTALIGATLPGGFAIGARKMRGIASEGMMCSARELGLGEEHAGLLILDETAPVGEDFIRYFGLDDVVLEIEVTPNRGDWSSMIGVARELAALFETTVRMPACGIRESAMRASEMSSVTIEDPELCPRYAGRVLSAALVAVSPLWMRRRLIAAGQRPINNLVDITNYVLLETGHPLHAFDYDLLAENRIVVRRARPGETLVAIDGQQRSLNSEMLVIADAQRPVAVAGVMGGRDSEVGERTRRVFLESAYFNPVSVRRTSRALGLQTEASAHFQRGADPEMVVYALDRAASLMQELAGAETARGILDAYPAPLPRRSVSLRYARTNLLLGTAVARETQRGVLTRLGFSLESESETECTCSVPSWRHDVAREVDLIEEVARFYGFDRLESALPSIRQSDSVFSPAEHRVQSLRCMLAGLGLTEMLHWTFSSPGEVRRCGLDEGYLDMVTLQNPLTENHTTMRSSLTPGLMATVARNLNYGNRDIAAFELGPVYVPVANQELPDEPLHVAIVLTGRSGASHWSRARDACDFYDVKGVAEAIIDFFGVEGTFLDAEMALLQAGHCGQVLADNKAVGFLGAVSGPVLDAYDIDQPVYLLECNVQDLLGAVAPVPQFESLAQFPPSLRDLAVLVAADVPAGSIVSAARQAGGKLLKSVALFDVYTGKQVAEGKKSVALSLVFQSDERTLTDTDTQKSCDKILRRLQDEFQAELR